MRTQPGNNLGCVPLILFAGVLASEPWVAASSRRGFLRARGVSSRQLAVGNRAKDLTSGHKDKAGDIVLADAGSSGTKVFAFSPEKAEEKLKTQCSEAFLQEGRNKQGIAALAYSKAECEWQIGPNEVLGTDRWTPLARAEPDYAQTVLELLARTYKASSGKNDTAGVKNRDAVPILATAGMRLVSQEDNAKVWGYVCGKNGSGFTFAHSGEACGTIPGTTEAYYEFLANAANGKGRRDMTGTFTIGGASAQISIPLRTNHSVEAFWNLIADIAGELDCRKLTIEDGSPAPFFNRGVWTDDRLACLEDYIAMRPAQDIQGTREVLDDNVKVSEIKGLGLISFLGLQGRGSFVAGGINQVGEWARSEGCDTEQADFEVCARKLQAALAQDIMWKHVTKYFRAGLVAGPAAFSYNTYAAVASFAGLPGAGSGSDQAWRLRDEVNHTCRANNGARFGYKESNTCMRAFYTSLYVTAFFSEPGSGNGGPDLHQDPHRDWSEGKVEELSLLSESHRLRIEHLLSTPLRRHETDYIDGAKIHLDAMAAGNQQAGVRSTLQA